MVAFLAGLGPLRGQRVLDVGCGEGRVFRSLLAEGADVLGLDPDPEAVALARATGVPVEVGGFEDLAGFDGFDWVLGVNSSFSHLLTVGSRHAAVKAVTRALVPGGIAVIDIPDFPWILANYRGPPRPLSRQGVTLHRTHELPSEGQPYFITTDLYERAGERREVRTVYAVFDPEELRYAFNRLGLRVRRFGGWSGGLADAGSRAVLVASL